MSTTPTATSPYPLFGTDFRLRGGLEQPIGHLPPANLAQIMNGNLAHPVTA